MKGTFNAYGASAETIGGSVPVWCGVVSPLPIGGVITPAPSTLVPAGTPVNYNMVAKTITIITKGSEAQANGYLYNDVKPIAGGQATGAVVMAHNEGLLINRVPGGPWNTDALKSAVPNVILVLEKEMQA